ncbi:hypothetical protein [Saccharibacillus kuerlensis]|uniref:Uncharacterized protein n=1 Tax=Saccharibacillus kuerlensis TaxID=459527 RepID=A0ABQ2L246_9BACL|nr:hypothetical protein [Saccharibacillus kuerlensis]GGN99781.1 hypothetical protein GCM10010969_20220 [Saccharibacillus kuerlensis]
MEERFREISSTKLLRKSYKATGLAWGFGKISLNTDYRVKKELITENSFSQLGSIKSGLVSSVETFKQLGIVFAIITFLLTTILGTLPMYMPQYFRTVDWTHQVNLLLIEDAISGMSNDEKQKYIIDKHDEEVSSYNQELSDVQNEHYNMLNIILWPIVIIFAVIFFRFRWLLSVQACVNEAYQEKEKIIQEEKEKLQKIKQRRESVLQK